MRAQRHRNAAGHVTRMSRRQRKKLRVGEFTQHGFSLHAMLTDGLDATAQDALLEAWLDAVDRLGLSFGGEFDGAAGRLDGVVFAVSAAVPLTAEHRQQLADWVEARNEVQTATVGTLFDVWHDR